VESAARETPVVPDRDVSLTEALDRVPEFRARAGVTRVGETTRLHRIGIPTMCAVVPDSASDVTIYNGRGLSRDRALVGAVMEAVERQTAARCEIAERLAAPASVLREIDLQRCGLRAHYARTRMPFVEARDLLSGAALRVPKALVQTPWRGIPAFAATHTNGLAAGLSHREAVYHALLEVVERHLFAVTHARAHLRPRRMLRAILGTDLPFVDDPVDEIEQPTGIRAIDELCERFRSAGLSLRLVALRAPHVPPAVLAGACDRERGEFHAGFGCSWSPVRAAIAAICEVAQARAANIQGARENILRADDPPSHFAENTRRRRSLPHGRWYFDAPTHRVRVADLAQRASGDLGADLRALVSAVGAFASRIAVVDLSPADRRYFVVRAIVPEAETTLLDGRIGPIARAIVYET
jgi:ribosomal protein S12 methylthiotransferase accessory factor